MDMQPPESGKPSVEGEDFVHMQDLKMESLSESMVRINEPSDTAATASSFVSESLGDSDSRPVALSEELSRNVVVLSCESAALGGICAVYLVGTAHVSEIISFGLRAVFVFRYITVFIQNKEESSREVQAIVNYLKPEVVFLELCSSRVAVLTLQNLKIQLKECEDCGGSGVCSACSGEGFVLRKRSEESAERARTLAKNMATRFTAGLPKNWSYCTKVLFCSILFNLWWQWEVKLLV